MIRRVDCQIVTIRHGVTFQDTWISSKTAVRPSNTIWNYTYCSISDFAISCIADVSTSIHTKTPLLFATSTELDGKWGTWKLKRILKKSAINVNSRCKLPSSVDGKAKLKHLFISVSWFCGESTGDFFAKMAHSSTHKLHKRVCTRQVNLGNTRCIALVNTNLY